ncbi:NACHT domain-containing protein [Micromonospora haikouensis]|uniref:NACHT domain-containing protein n=1 Tax=Micromonospora haikouensis TaxID=686309 RepID=UPI003D71B93B
MISIAVGEEASMNLSEGPRRTAARRWPWVLAGVGMLALAWYLAGPIVGEYLDADLSTRDQMSSVASLWVAMVSLMVSTIAVWSQHRQASRSASVSVPSVADVAEQLGQAVQHQWEGEEERRRIHDPVALSLRWKAVDAFFDHKKNIGRSPARAQGRPIQLNGRLSEIAQVYLSIPSRRLVVLGSDGSGKTVLAARLALDLLQVRQPGERVPVIVSVAAWDPTSTDLAGWLTAKLARDYPGLAPARSGLPNLAAELLKAHLILPILDGFDEIPRGLRNRALKRLNDVPRMPLVLTSRPTEYTAAIGRGRVLSGAAGIELAALDLPDIEDYLSRSTRREVLRDGRHCGVWDPVLDRLRLQPAHPANSAVRQALSTPLMLSLARTVYGDTPEHDPLELLDTAWFPDCEAIERHLVAAYLPVVYDHADKNGRHWPPERAHRWLAHLASHLDQSDSRDIAWWRLRNGIPKVHRFWAFLVAFYPAATFGGFGLSRALHLEPVSFVGPLMGGFVAQVLANVTCVPAEGPDPARTRFDFRHRLPHLVSMLGLGLMAGLTAGSILAWLIGPPIGSSFVIAFGLALGLSMAVTAASHSWIDIDTEVSPASALSGDRRHTILTLLQLGCAVSVFASFISGPVYGVVVGLATGLMWALTSAWGQWLVLIRLWLPLRGRLPWRTFAFLSDARDRGVLRQVGAVYQFRHARLQHYLSGADHA